MLNKVMLFEEIVRVNFWLLKRTFLYVSEIKEDKLLLKIKLRAIWKIY